MAGTQQLPSWMTLSTIVITNAEGQPVTTSITTLQLPLTYYGPSIPLGTDGAWTYGGLTTPAPTSSVHSAATPTSTSFSTASSTFTSPPTSTLTSNPTSGSTSLSVATTTASSTPSSSSTSPTSSTLSKGAIIGIVFGTFVFFVLVLLVLICFLRWRARRRNSGYRQTPIWTHWEVVSPAGRQTDEDRPAGVGSPRGSGEEADSFLQRSAGATDGTRGVSSTVRPVPSLPPGAAPPHIIGSTHSGDSGHTSSSAVTDYGVLLPDGGRIGQAYRDESHPPARASSEMAGHIMPPGELLRIDDEVPESPPRMYGVPRTSDPLLPEAFAPLLPPPPLEIDRISYRRPSSLNEKEKSIRSLSYPASDMEDSKVYTARRVRVQELGPRSPADDETSSNTHAEIAPVAGPSSWRDSFGLGSIARFRRSWFGGSSSKNTSKSSQGRLRSDDVESQSLLAPPRSRSRGGLGLTVDGERPMSSVSTKSAVSGNTVYHDAVSRLGTPVSVPSRAMTPANGGGAVPGSDFVPPLPTGEPPAYAFTDPYESVTSRGSFPYSQGVDVLDLPAPEPASPFTASGGTSGTTRSAAFPPGLGGSHAGPWRDSLSVVTGSSNDAGITIDILDAEPPRAGERWRSIAGGLLDIRRGGGSAPDLGDRRTTFGTPQLVHQHHPMLSEQGSLHSMRSYLSPYSRSSRSAPTSSGHSQGLTGSNSSRPSAHSRIQTASSGSVHSGSLSSDQPATSGLPISPAISAFGTGATDSGRLSREMEELPSPLFGGPNRISVLGPMPSFTARSVMTAPTIRSVGATTTSDETEVTRTTVTTGTGTSGGTLVDGEDSDNFVERFKLENLDFDRVRI